MLLVDDVGGAIGEALESLISLSVEFTELIADEIFGVFGKDQLHEGLTVFLLELFEDVATAETSHLSHRTIYLI